MRLLFMAFFIYDAQFHVNEIAMNLINVILSGVWLNVIRKYMLDKKNGEMSNNDSKKCEPNYGFWWQ